MASLPEIKNISQDYIAKHLGISQAAYSSIENGKTKVDAEKLDQIANILKVNPAVIKNFNEQIVFNSCIQSGLSNTYHINPLEKTETLYEKLLMAKDKQIQMLEQIILKNNTPKI